MKLLKNRISGSDWGLFCFKEVQFDWHKEVQSAANEKQSEREAFYGKIGGEKEKLGAWVDVTKAKEELDVLWVSSTAGSGLGCVWGGVEASSRDRAAVPLSAGLFKGDFSVFGVLPISLWRGILDRLEHWVCAA